MLAAGARPLPVTLERHTLGGSTSPEDRGWWPSGRPLS
jgi:hypothetical protein